LQRLGDLRLLDGIASLKVGDGSGDAHDSMDRATTELQPLGGGFQQRLALGIEGGVAAELRARERAVPRALWPALSLASPRGHHSVANVSARFSENGGPQQLAGRLPRHQHLQIDSVSYRAGQPGTVTLPLQRGALAKPTRVAGKATGARIRGGDQNEARREHCMPAGARHC
jgi:hypothetical protein